jgi:hypothetical protein
VKEKSAYTHTRSLWFLFFEVLYIYQNSLHPYYDIIKMHYTVLSEQDKILIIKKTVKKKCKLSLWFFIFIKTVYLLTVTSLRCTILHIANKPKGCFVTTDVLSLRTFCPTNVMSPAVLSPDVLPPGVLSLRTFCLRTFCLGTFSYS